MGKYLVALVLFMGLFACKDKKQKGNQPIGADDVFEAYPALKLPFVVSDTNMQQGTDTMTISDEDFAQFIPDSLLNNPFGKDRKLTIHPIGKIVQKGKETYFVTYVSTKKKKAIYLSVYDKNKFTVAMPLLIGNDDSAIHTASIDKRLTIVLNSEWNDKTVQYYNRVIYAYNNVGIFTTVLTETNVAQNSGTQFINPIDTFPKKNKYSGDYAKGAKYFLAIRDTKSPLTYRFFVHFQTDDKDDPCGGELKGEFKMTSDKAGVYTGTGDPCVLDLTFAGSKVMVKETGSCGNYRGIKCFFNDTYTKKKEPKAAPVRK